MTVGELVTELMKYDPNLEVIYEKYSDYSRLEKSDIEVGRAIPRPSADYYQRLDEYTSPEYAKDAEDYLIFPGN